MLYVGGIIYYLFPHCHAIKDSLFSLFPLCASPFLVVELSNFIAAGPCLE